MTRKNAISHIWYTRCPVPTPVGLATQLGLLDTAFAAEGIKLNSIIDSKDRSIRSSHFDHHLDYSFRHGGNVPPIRARSEGNPTRLVGITWTDEFQAIITLSETGIKTTRDLVGRRFGIARRPPGIVDFMAATALKGLVSALSLDGLAPSDVEIVDIPLSESVLDGREGPQLYGLRNRQAYGPEIAALLRGEVDTIYVKGTPGIAVANLFAARTVAEFGFHPDPKIRINSGSPRVLTVDERLAEHRPDLVAKLIATLKQAGAWAEEHPDEVRRFVAREVGASEEVVAAANGPDLHKHLGIGLEPELVAAIGHYKDFLHEWGFLECNFDINAWVDHRPWAELDVRTVA
ncbi:ABC transporter substrate-binding protein [Sinorhizobium meliloti]|uniref:ABC transporter substrate-binding protein n=1 Tax=Rhizobium meliloti TaxID=382 RepID=UPI000B4A0909|nr:ABC transporter substrate-binding protein [Sinorhizobium meliloti]ASP54023.1 desulfurase [Sinorhizobium meliloti]MDW9476859.1 ABC transporter substrate-binding protein [Sinorhizobium meliloti]MDX0017400.1 ABC transporter substrate-binding protein [Sinorhizobium meliloti]MDX0305307.1 ABC transporter substrate-binding protein [Sinorhizobium meliloti]MDX0378276.1 ABC transporter substrate-binding protein [Sinorhizobium meliloti]